MPFALDRRKCPACGVVVQGWLWPMTGEVTCSICGHHRNGDGVGTANAPLARVPDHVLQAEAFVEMLQRLGPSADLKTEFHRWAATKDFSPSDGFAIARHVRRLLAQRAQP